ncbi:hypothetical protein EDB89DRAFT_1910845 [Lactarius sanguifluus]|nr:hypothetical protein EDB89DRAFT_1910845 [Lactarius sanguifluus]
MARHHRQGPSRSPLPDRESLPPNQHTWTKTAKQMGAKRRKRPHQTNSSPTAPATEQIGKLNRKQACMKNTDPYSSGLQSGKDAALDAQTAAQNADTRAHASVGEPLPSQPSKRCCKRTSTPPPPPSSAPAPGPLAPFAWYPTYAAYPTGTHSQVPYHATPMYWPYAPSQPYHPSTQ